MPTWAPFRLQFYGNGHNWLAGQLAQAGLAFQQLDNTFRSIQDWDQAQALSDAFPIERLPHRLDALAARHCPVAARFGSTYHWSILQVEYATDLVFHRQQDLRPRYESLVRRAIHAVKPADVATFLGRKLTGNVQDELGNDFHTRIEGTRIKHHMGPVALKLYDKQALVLRLETTVNDVSFFAHHRTVEHRDGTREIKLAPMQKTIYSLAARLAWSLWSANLPRAQAPAHPRPHPEGGPYRQVLPDPRRPAGRPDRPAAARTGRHSRVGCRLNSCAFCD